ncbi:MAG: tRNA-modifying protein YgfZ, partial [Gemmatimonadota bacterium]
FDALWISGPGHTPGGGDTLRPAWHADALRMLAGWPRVGREIDDKTLPQEVRFDALASVAYDKGCYVGQETVARLHFRGHANRTLRAVVGQGVGPASDVAEDVERKTVGRLTSLARIGSHWMALARVRREVESGEAVRVGEQEASVRDLPLTEAMIAGW